MNWNLEGLRVKGVYLGSIPVQGLVDLSRVQYGGTVSHHIQLDTPITVYGAHRDRVILEHHNVEQVMDNHMEDSRYDDQFELDSDYN